MVAGRPRALLAPAAVGTRMHDWLRRWFARWSDGPEAVPGPGADSAREVFPARTAIGATVVLSLAYMTVITLAGSIEKRSVLGFLWASARLNVPMGFHPRVPERAREGYIAVTW